MILITTITEIFGKNYSPARFKRELLCIENPEG